MRAESAVFSLSRRIRLFPTATVCAVLVTWVGSVVAADVQIPIALHPSNPHYLLFRGRPTVLITSTEHYGSVLNLDFHYVPYLDELHARGLNLTRTFTGVYCEDQRSFGIHGNPLAPAAGRLICPWARSAVPGYLNGGPKFDLTKWDDAYFVRLKDFVSQASQRGIVVELALFCPFYEDSMWNLSPMKSANNVNGIGNVPRTEVYTLKHQDLLAVQEALVRKIVAELAEFDNLYFEVCNEPYFGSVTGEWQDRIIATILAAEANRPHRHLIAQNIANGSQQIENPNPAVSIFNFHYATPPHAVAANYRLGKVIADDETGFKGKADFTYRAEGWDFLLGGGAVYDNLDYSFTPGKEDGTAAPDAPGGGGAALRTQLKILKGFMESLALVRMAPDNSVIAGKLPASVTARALVEKGKQYAIYIRGDGLANLDLDLPAGRYRVQWVDTKHGPIEPAQTLDHAGGRHSLRVPHYRQDIAVRVTTDRP